MTLHPSTPFVVFGDDWGRHVSTMQWVFRCIAERHPVIWVDSIGHRVPTFSGRDVRRAWERLRAVPGLRSRASVAPTQGAAPLAIVRPRALPWHHVPWVFRWNTGQLLRAVRSTLAQLGIAPGRSIVVTGSPPSVGVVERLGARTNIYLCMDDFRNHPTATASMIAPLEDRLLDCVDGVLVTAENLLQRRKPRSGHIRLLRQGVNYDFLAAPRDIPDDLRHLPRPILGFMGVLSEWCDLETLTAVADAFPSASVVILGPVAVAASVAEQMRRPNVHFLGKRSYAEIPAYCRQFDVGLIPYQVSEATRSVSPLKLLEYLAAGVPVVSTPLPEVVALRAPVATASGPREFIAAVRGALDQSVRDDVATRQAYARAARWEHRAEEVLDFIASSNSRGESTGVYA